MFMTVEWKMMSLHDCIVLILTVTVHLCESRVLFLSIDGFNWEYFDRHKEQLPTMHQMAEEGVFVDKEG